MRYLIDVLGGAQLAAVVGVNRSQPSRWATGEERPGPIAAPLLIDLEHVIARARLVWGEAAAATWMVSTNSYLDGARPIDVLTISGPAPVLDALDAETWGGAA
ncbi:MbcA/ParS/Xre antitoxin family protein [Mycobacterium avium]|uniref:MbcA/ParS/Xre antitoxin family protein n=1 Tax=Mycobacterium avium TaxID=1764 RepID=UPI00211CCDF9|nr:MbcA/ParS/Xre antitoxin family protein [Mycobacterium avium]